MNADATGAVAGGVQQRRLEVHKRVLSTQLVINLKGDERSESVTGSDKVDKEVTTDFSNE
jgi:hypothetical protein